MLETFFSWSFGIGALLALYLFFLALYEYYIQKYPNDDKFGFGLTSPVYWAIMAIMLIPGINLWIVCEALRSSILRLALERLKDQRRLLCEVGCSTHVGSEYLHYCTSCRVRDISLIEADSVSGCILCKLCGKSGASGDTLAQALRNWNSVNDINDPSWKEIPLYRAVWLAILRISTETARMARYIKLRYRRTSPDKT